jgi:hypothetical protein
MKIVLTSPGLRMCDGNDQQELTQHRSHDHPNAQNLHDKPHGLLTTSENRILTNNYRLKHIRRSTRWSSRRVIGGRGSRVCGERGAHKRGVFVPLGHLEFTVALGPRIHLIGHASRTNDKYAPSEAYRHTVLCDTLVMRDSIGRAI